jgi:uncharacterized membrane protein
MFREAVGKHYIGMNKEFRFRGEEPGRLENLSDGVFSLAITLLLISTNAPSNFDQIKKFVWELFPFSACIVLFLLIWYEHFVFFFRYGLRNMTVIVLNSTLLVIVLFYVYPLKFLLKLLLLYPIALMLDERNLLEELSGMLKLQDVGQLMIIYGMGATGIFLVLMLMYRYALKNAKVLNLTLMEEFDTRTSMHTNFLMATVPLLSVSLAIAFRDHKFVGMISGFTYFLYTPLMFTHKFLVARQRRKLLAEVTQSLN